MLGIRVRRPQVTMTTTDDRDTRHTGHRPLRPSDSSEGPCLPPGPTADVAR
jgi:hypothetical protein